MIEYTEIESKEEYERIKEYMRNNIGPGHTLVDPETYEPYVVIEGKNYRLKPARDPKTGFKLD